MALVVKVLQEGGKHATVVTSGYLDGNTSINLLTLKDLAHQPSSLYITEIQYAVEKMAISLFWGMKGELEPELIIPLEGRGKFDFSAFRGLQSPRENWEGNIILSALDVNVRRHLLLILHLEKGSG